MAQVTLYLDDATEELLSQAAQSSGMSKSRWVAELIRAHAANEWPQDCIALAGRFPDFPLRQEPSTSAADVPRVDF